jgi:hypothetical protein
VDVGPGQVGGVEASAHAGIVNTAGPSRPVRWPCVERLAASADPRGATRTVLCLQRVEGTVWGIVDPETPMLLDHIPHFLPCLHLTRHLLALTLSPQLRDFV